MRWASSVVGATAMCAGIVVPAIGLGATRICFEAEVGVITQPVALAEDAGASGTKCVNIPEGVGKPPDVQGDVAYKIAVPDEGSYVLWARCFWDDGCGNSFRVSLDGGEPATLGEDGTYKRWHWVMLKGTPLKLSKGDHEIRLMNNEDGIKVDQFLLLTDRLYVPVAIEKPNCEPKPPGASPDPGKPAEGGAAPK